MVGRDHISSGAADIWVPAAIEAPLEKIKQLTSLYSIELCHCKSMSTLPQWLGELISLQELHITKWPELNGWQSIRHLTSLQKLVVNCCDSIQALPEWLVILPLSRKYL
jgi:hypothetical protein